MVEHVGRESQNLVEQFVEQFSFCKMCLFAEKINAGITTVCRLILCYISERQTCSITISSNDSPAFLDKITAFNVSNFCNISNLNIFFLIESKRQQKHLITCDKKNEMGDFACEGQEGKFGLAKCEDFLLYFCKCNLP